MFPLLMIKENYILGGPLTLWWSLSSGLPMSGRGGGLCNYRSIHSICKALWGCFFCIQLFFMGLIGHQLTFSHGLEIDHGTKETGLYHNPASLGVLEG